MKADKLTPKALTLLANMRGFSEPVSSRDLAFLAPNPAGSREWALSTLRRLADMQLLQQGPRVEGGMTFSVTDAGHQAVLEQTPEFQITPWTTLYEYDGPILFNAEVLGATRLVMADDLKGNTYYMSTPDPITLDRVISSQEKVVEAMVCEPCLKVVKAGTGAYTASPDILSSEAMREYCGESALLNPPMSDQRPEV